jgi:hypothetical protein
MRITCTLIDCAAVSFLLATTAKGQFQSAVFITQNTVINDDRTGIPYVVGYANRQDFDARQNGVSVTFTVTENGKVGGAVAGNGSVINNSGYVGRPGIALGALDNGTANMTSGFAYWITANQGGKIRMSGGRTNYVELLGSSDSNFENAIIGDPSLEGGPGFEARESSTVTISETQIIDELRAINGARVKANGTNIGRDVIARNAADIQLRGSSVGGDLLAFDGATVRGSDGTIIEENVKSDGGSILLTGATVGKSVRSEGGTVTVIDSSIGEDLQANATIGMTGGIVQGSATVGEFGNLAISGGQVVGNVTHTGIGLVNLDRTEVGGNVSASNGTINAEIDGNLISTGNNTNARLNVTGGTISGDLLANGRGTVILSGGEIAGDAVVATGGTIEMSGGSVNGDFANNNVARIYGGEVLGDVNSNNGLIRMEGGRIGQDVNAAAFYFLGGDVVGKAEIGLGGFLFMAGGALAGDANLAANSQGQFFGGTVAGNVNAPSGVMVTIDEEGTITGNLVLGEASSAVMRNGMIGGSIAAAGTNQTRLDISGGTIAGDVALSIGAGLVMEATVVGRDLLIRDATTACVNGGHFQGNVIASGAGLSGDASLGSVVIDGDLRATDTRHVTATGTIGGNVLATGHARVFFGDLAIDSFVAGNLDTTDFSAIAAIATTVNGNALVRNGDAAMILDQSKVEGDVIASNGGRIELVQGTQVIGNVNAAGFANITLHGMVNGNVNLNDSTLRFATGWIDGDVIGTGLSNVLHGFGAIRGSLVARDSTTIIMSGGRVAGDLVAEDGSTVFLSDGRVEGYLFGFETSEIVMTGGSVVGLAVISSTATLRWSGGTIDGELPPASPGSLVPNGLPDDALVAAGGAPTAVILMHDSSTLNIIGNDLDAMLIDPNYQENFSLYQLSGKLADGTAVNDAFFAIQNGTGASYQLLPVPEPAAITLLLAMPVLLLPRTAAMHRPQSRRSVPLRSCPN